MPRASPSATATFAPWVPKAPDAGRDGCGRGGDGEDSCRLPGSQPPVRLAACRRPPARRAPGMRRKAVAAEMRRASGGKCGIMAMSLPPGPFGPACGRLGEMEGSWWVPRPSKPLRGVQSVSGAFDSHASPPRMHWGAPAADAGTLAAGRDCEGGASSGVRRAPQANLAAKRGGKGADDLSGQCCHHHAEAAGSGARRHWRAAVVRGRGTRCARRGAGSPHGCLRGARGVGEAVRRSFSGAGRVLRQRHGGAQRGHRRPSAAGRPRHHHGGVPQLGAAAPLSGPHGRHVALGAAGGA